MATIILDPGEVFEHYHSEDSSTILQEGAIRCSLDGRELDLAPGEAVHVLAGMPHSLYNVGDVPARVICVHKPIVNPVELPPKYPPQ